MSVLKITFNADSKSLSVPRELRTIPRGSDLKRRQIDLFSTSFLSFSFWPVYLLVGFEPGQGLCYSNKTMAFRNESGVNHLHCSSEMKDPVLVHAAPLLGKLNQETST